MCRCVRTGNVTEQIRLQFYSHRRQLYFDIKMAIILQDLWNLLLLDSQKIKLPWDLLSLTSICSNLEDCFHFLETRLLKTFALCFSALPKNKIKVNFEMIGNWKDHVTDTSSLETTDAARRFFNNPLYWLCVNEWEFICVLSLWA